MIARLFILLKEVVKLIRVPASRCNNFCFMVILPQSSINIRSVITSIPLSEHEPAWNPPLLVFTGTHYSLCETGAIVLTGKGLLYFYSDI